jgi:hypothetical protein
MNLTRFSTDDQNGFNIRVIECREENAFTHHAGRAEEEEVHKSLFIMPAE